MDSMETDPVMEPDPVENPSMETDPVQNPCDLIPIVDPKESNRVFVLRKKETVFVSAHHAVKMGAKVEFHGEFLKILGDPTPAFVLKDKHELDVSTIVVVWHPQHGTFTGLLHSGAGEETVYNIVTHTPSLLNQTLVHVSYENLCGVKIFQNTTDLFDSEQHKITVNAEVMPVTSSPHTEHSGFVTHLDPDSNSVFIVSMDMNRAFRVLGVAPWEIQVVPASMMQQRTIDRKVLAETKKLTDSMIRLLKNVSFHFADESFIQIASAAEANLLEIIKSRETATPAIQIDILAPFLRNFYRTAQILNNSFLEWISGTTCAQDPVLQELIAQHSASAAARPGQQQQRKPKPKPSRPAIFIKKETEITIDDVTGPFPPGPKDDIDLRLLEDEDGFHRVIRQMPVQARLREQRMHPSFIQLPPDQNFHNLSIAFQISDVFCNAPNESWTMREFRRFAAGDYVRVTDPQHNNRLYIVLMFAQKNGPRVADAASCFVELKCFSNEKPNYNVFENIDTVYIPPQRCVHTTESGQIIGPGDRCRRMMPENELITVFVSAIADGLCIYALVPRERKVMYDICPCSELVFVADGPPRKWGYDSVAYNTRVNKNQLGN